MGSIFSNAHSFNQSLGNKFDTSNVTVMGSMFAGASAFNQSLGDKFDTSKVTNMADMFRNATIFTQDLSNWNVDKVTSRANFSTNGVLTAAQLPKFK